MNDLHQIDDYIWYKNDQQTRFSNSNNLKDCYYHYVNSGTKNPQEETWKSGMNWDEKKSRLEDIETQIHGYSTRKANTYLMHNCLTNFKKITILYQGPKIWNSLPGTVTSLSSFTNFKKKLWEFSVK